MTHRLHPALIAVVLGLGTLGAPAMSAHAQAPAIAAPAHPAGTLLSVSASAQASAAPDIASISTGVVTEAAEANAAMRANASQMTKVVAALRAAGIAERDIQTGSINLHPQYRYVENAAPVITGYQANNSVNVKVRDIAKVGQVLDALVASGANQISGPSFSIEAPEPVYDKARQAALKQAQARAQMYAAALGLRVRRIVSISEGGGFHAPMPAPMMKMEMASADVTPVAPGETTLGANLDIVFELGE